MSGVMIENYEKNTLKTAGRADSVESRISQDENAPIDLDNISSLDNYELEKIRDKRGYNLLMLAAESGHLEAANELLYRGCSVDDEAPDGETASSLAFAQGSYGFVFGILVYGGKFPNNFKRAEVTGDLRDFTELSIKIHENIKEGKIENLSEIFENYPDVKCIYDPENNSALRIAIEHKQFSIVDILLKNNIYTAPHEDIGEITYGLSPDEKQILRDIHEKHSKNVLREPMMTLMRNSYFGPDTPQRNDYRTFVHDAYDFLLNFPFIAIYMQIIAASKYFTISYDFNRESVNYLVPSSEPYANGLFKLSGKIYIAAKNLLDPERIYEVYGVIAHELCHYAMYLVYNNEAKPYFEKDHKTAAAFHKSLLECRKNRTHEPIIQSVFDCYPFDFHHAELIVRVPQMFVLYHENRDILEDRKIKFPKIFTHFNEITVPDMKKALPKIQARFKSKKDQQISKLRRIILILLVILGILGIIATVLGVLFLQPKPKWDKLTNEQKDRVLNADLSYKDVDVKFKNLFAKDSGIYDILVSDDIQHALKGHKNELSDSVAVLYDQFVHLQWSNMSDSLRDRLLISNVTFQHNLVPLCSIVSQKCQEFTQFPSVDLAKVRKTVSLTKIIGNNSESLEHISVSDVRKLLNGQEFLISKEMPLTSKYSVERFYIPEDFNDSSIDDWEQIEKEKLRQRYQKDSSNADNDDFVNTIEDFDDILREAENNKIFLLSDRAGEGKTTTFNFIWIKLIEKYHFKWIQHVDLKKHISGFDQGRNKDLSKKEDLLEFITRDLLNISKLEKEIFTNLFESNNAIFLFDGIDEISPHYKNFMIDFVGSVRRFTKNIQFLSTRPQHSKDFREKFNIKAYRLIPLGRLSRLDLYVKYFVVEKLKLDISDSNLRYYEVLTEIFIDKPKNVSKTTETVAGISQTLLKNALNENDKKYPNITIAKSKKYEKFSKYFKMDLKPAQETVDNIEKCEEIMESIEKLSDKSQHFANPLLFRMIAEIVKNDESDECTDYEKRKDNYQEIKNLSLYNIYEIFIEKLAWIAKCKGRIVEGDTAFINDESLFTKEQIHQAFALMTIIKGFLDEKLPEFKLTDIKVVNFVNNSNLLEKISRYGIISSISTNDFDFIHRTFAEYYVAQYLNDNIDDNFVAITNESKIQLYLLNAVLFSDSFKIVKNFLISHSESSHQNRKESGPSNQVGEKETEFNDYVINLLRNLKSKKLEKIFKSQEIIKFFTYLEFSEKFEKKDIKLRNFLIYKPYELKLSDFKEFFEKADDLKEIYRESFKYAFKMEDIDGHTLLYEVLNLNNNLLLTDFLTMYKTLINSNDIDTFNILGIKAQKSKRSRRATDLLPSENNALFHTVETLNVEIVKNLWNFLNQTLSNSSQKSLLSLKNAGGKTILQLSASNKNPGVFGFIKDLYENRYQERIEEIILEVHEYDFPFVFDAIRETKEENCRVIAEYLEMVFLKNNGKGRKNLRDFLTLRNKEGNTFFGVLTSKKNQELIKNFTMNFKTENSDSITNNLLIFIDLLHKSLEDDEKFNFVNYFTSVQQKIPLARILNYNIELSPSKLKELRNPEWRFNDFKFLLDNFEAIINRSGKKTINQLLMNLNDKSQSVFHDLMTYDDNQPLIELFLNKIQLEIDEKKKLLNQKDENNITPLMVAAKLRNITDFEVFWNFTMNILDDSEINEILMSEDEHFDKILQYSTYNGDPETFEFVWDVYEQLFNNSEMKKVLIHFNHNYYPFFFTAVEKSSEKTLNFVARKLKDVFNNTKNLEAPLEDLKEFLSIRSFDGETVFSRFRSDTVKRSKLAILMQLFKSTLTKEDNLREILNDIELSTKVEAFYTNNNDMSCENLQNLRNNPWNQKDFEYLMHNWNKLMKQLSMDFCNKTDKFTFLIKTLSNNKIPLIFDYKSITDENLAQNFLSHYAKLFNESEIISLLLFQNPTEKLTPFTDSVDKTKFEVLKTFWTFHERYLTKDQLRSILLTPNKLFNVALQISTLNHDPKAFLFIKDLYLSTFSRKKVVDILYNFEKSWYPFFYIAIARGSEETCKELAKFLLDIFSEDKDKLKELLTYENNGKNIFEYLRPRMELQDRLKIFAELNESLDD